MDRVPPTQQWLAARMIFVKMEQCASWAMGAHLLGVALTEAARTQSNARRAARQRSDVKSPWSALLICALGFLVAATCGVAEARFGKPSRTQSHPEISRPDRTPDGPNFRGPDRPVERLPDVLNHEALPRVDAIAQFGEPVRLESGEFGYHVRPGLVVPEGSLSPSKLWYLNQPLPPAGKRFIASFIDPTRPDAQKIRDAAGDRYAELPSDIAGIRSLLENMDAKHLTIVGHSENGFLVRNATIDGVLVETGRVSLSDLYAALGTRDIHIYFLTCKGACQVRAPGVSGDLWTPEVVQRIIASADAKTFGDFYSALGSKENPTILQGVELQLRGLEISYIARSEQKGRSDSLHVEGRGQIVNTTLLLNNAITAANRREKETRESEPSEGSGVLPILFVLIILGGTIYVMVLVSRWPDSPRSVVGTDRLAGVDLSDDWQAQLAIKGVLSGSNANPIKAEIAAVLYKVRAGKITKDDGRASLLSIAERIRSFPSATDLRITAEDRETLIALLRQPEQTEAQLELIAVLLAFRRGFEPHQVSRLLQRLARQERISNQVWQPIIHTYLFGGYRGASQQFGGIGARS